jgi:hypothetical protein
MENHLDAQSYGAGTHATAVPVDSIGEKSYLHIIIFFFFVVDP